MCDALGGVHEIEALAKLLSQESDHVDQVGKVLLWKMKL